NSVGLTSSEQPKEPSKATKVTKARHERPAIDVRKIRLCMGSTVRVGQTTNGLYHPVNRLGSGRKATRRFTRQGPREACPSASGGRLGSGGSQVPYLSPPTLTREGSTARTL